MTNQLIVKLGTLSVSVATHFKEEARAFEPQLMAAAEDVGHKLEAWTSAVDHWVETHFEPEAEKLREEAGAAYRLAVTKAHELIDAAKAHLQA